MEKRRTNLTVVITSVSSKGLIKKIAEEHNINPQEVFVRIGFRVGEKDYSSSNKLRFLGIEGYRKVLEAKETGEPVNITLTVNEKGSLIYINSDEDIEIEDLFATPVTKVDNRNDVLDLF